MKKIVFYTLILALFSAHYATAQQQETQPEKAKKEVVIIKEKVGKDGKVVIEKIIRNAEPGEIIIDDSGNKTFRVEVKEDSENDGQHLVIIKDGKVLTEDKLGKDFESEDIDKIDVILDVDDEGKKFKKIIIQTHEDENVFIEKADDVEFERDIDVIDIRKETDENGELKQTYHIKMKDTNGEILEWKGDGELPVELQEKVEKMKMKLHMMQGNDILHLEHPHHGSNESKAFLGVVAGEKVEVTNDVEETSSTANVVDGAPITEVVEGSAAAEAGLQANDVITSFDGQQVANFKELAELIHSKKPDDVVEIQYTRDGQPMTTTATLKGKAFKYAVVMTDEDVHVDHRERIIIITRGKKAEEEATATTIPAIDETEFPAYDPNANKLEMEGFDAFPNPTDGLLQLQFKTNPGATTIRVTDIAGQQFYREFIRDFDGIYNKQVDLTDVPKGAYLLSVNQEGRIYTQKLLIQ